MAVAPLDISQGILAPVEILGADFQDGVAISQISYNLYGTIAIRAEDSKDTTRQGLSPEITFLPKSLSAQVELPGTRDFFYIGEPIGLVVKVNDEVENPIPNYPGIIELSSAAGLALLGEYAYTREDAGRHQFLATALKAGEYSVSVQTPDGFLKAESQPIVVKNAFLQVIDTVSPVGTAEVIIKIVDESGNVIHSENNLTIGVQAVEEVDDKSAVLPSGPIQFTDGKAIIRVADTQAEVVTIVPSSSYKLQVKKGTVTFGRVGKSGVSTLMWRELKGK